MGLFVSLFLAVVSVLAVIFGAEIVVDKMRRLASYFGVSELFIGLTVISLGTSLPELSLHIVGSFSILNDSSLLESVSGTLLGMNIGSDIVQQTLIMGTVVFLASFIAGKDEMNFTKDFIKENYIPMILAHLMVLIFAFNGFLTRLEGFSLVTAFIFYILFLYGRKSKTLLGGSSVEPSRSPLKDGFIGLVAMTGLIYFSDLFLSLTEALISATGLSGSMIGVVLVGFVSAMPEFMTAISGLRNNAQGISLGTLIGSNITNPLLAIGAGTIISTYSVPRPTIFWDLPIQIITAATLVIYLWNREKIGELFESLFNMYGLEKMADKAGEMENGVLTAFGGVALILTYFIYLGIRGYFFSVDFA